MHKVHHLLSDLDAMAAITHTHPAVLDTMSTWILRN